MHDGTSQLAPNPLTNPLPRIVTIALCVLTFQEVSKRPGHALQLAIAPEACRRQAIDKMLQRISGHLFNLHALLTGDYDALSGDSEVSGLAALRTTWVLKPWLQVPKLLQHFIAIRPLSCVLPVFDWRELRDIRWSDSRRPTLHFPGRRLP